MQLSTTICCKLTSELKVDYTTFVSFSLCSSFHHMHTFTERCESLWWDELKRCDSSALLTPWKLRCQLFLPPVLRNVMNFMSHGKIKSSIRNCCLHSIVLGSEVEHMDGKMYRPKEPALSICSSPYHLYSTSPPLSHSFSCEPATECQWREEMQAEQMGNFNELENP